MTSTYPNTNYLILDGAAAAAASVSLAAGVLSVGSPLQQLCKYNAITKASITVAVTAVPKVDSIAITNTANTVYQVAVQQFNPATGRTYNQIFTYTTGATVAAGEISTYFANVIDAATAASQLFVNGAGGGATLTITGLTGTEVFTATVIQGTMVNTPGAGNFAVGTTAALALQGITVTGTDYTTCHIEFAPVSGMNIKDGVSVASAIDIYVNETDDSGFVAALTGYLDGSSAADATAVI